MRAMIIAFLLVLAAACSADNTATSQSQPVTTEAGTESRVAAVLMYADWCGSCKVLDPKLKAVQAKGDIKGLDYVVLDYTARDTAALFSAADAASVGPAIRTRFAEKVKTGLLVLVDLGTGEIISELNKTMSEAEIEAALKSSVQAA